VLVTDLGRGISRYLQHARMFADVTDG